MMTPDEIEDRRSLERRVFELEQKMSRLLTVAAVTEAQVAGLIETVKSRFISFDRGIELILERQKTEEARVTTLEVVKSKIETVDELRSKVDMLENLKNKIEGAIMLVQILGVIGIVGGIVAIIKAIK